MDDGAGFPASSRRRLTRALVGLDREGSAWSGGGGGRDGTLPIGDRGGPGIAGSGEDARAGGPAGRMLARLGAGAFDPGRRGLRALAAAVVVVVLVAALIAWWTRPQPDPVAPRLAATGEPPAATATVPAELVVAVSGMVHQPGLVRLPPGSRVADAIEAAGGLLPDADVDHLNLARRVTDGELIAVGIPPPPGGQGAPGGGTGGPGGPGGRVNLNTATQADLETLPGIGPALAQRIIAYRTEHGQFTSVDELRAVSGIGEARFADLEDLVTV